MQTTTVQLSDELIETFFVTAQKIGDSYRYQVHITYISSDRDNWTDWIEYPTSQEAIEAGIESVYRQAATSQLRDILDSWVDDGLIDESEYESADSSLSAPESLIEAIDRIEI